MNASIRTLQSAAAEQGLAADAASRAQDRDDFGSWNQLDRHSESMGAPPLKPIALACASAASMLVFLSALSGLIPRLRLPLPDNLPPITV